MIMINQSESWHNPLVLEFILDELPVDKSEFEKSLECYENLRVSYDLANLLTTITVEIDIPKLVLRLYRQNDEEAREFVQTIKFNFKERCQFAMHKVNSLRPF